MALTMADLDVSWTTAVERFVTANTSWLNDSHLPQLKALYSVAKLLDQGVKVTPALLSQFTLTQRTLAGKAPGADAGDDMPPPLGGIDDMLGRWAPGASHS